MLEMVATTVKLLQPIRIQPLTFTLFHCHYRYFILSVKVPLPHQTDHDCSLLLSHLLIDLFESNNGRKLWANTFSIVMILYYTAYT